MAFKMKGSQFYGKLKLNRNMDDSSQPDGRAKSSAFQKDKASSEYTGPKLPKKITDELSNQQKIQKKKDAKGKNKLHDDSYKPRVGFVESIRKNESKRKDKISKALDEKYPDRYKGGSFVEDVKRSAYSDKEKETQFPKDPPKAYRDSVRSVYKKGGAPKCAPGGGPGDGCGGNFKVKKKGTVVSRALNKAGKWAKGELDDAVHNIKKTNKKRKNKRNTVKTPKNKGQRGHIVRSSDSYN